MNVPDTTIGQWHTPAEAATLLHVPVDTIYLWLKHGDLQGVNLARNADGERPRWRISRVEIARFLFDREAGLRGYVKAN